MFSQRRVGRVPVERGGYASRTLASMLCALALLLVAPRAEAYAWMIKHGYSNCGACHSDPSGGELLTVYGRAMSEAFLSMKWGSDASDAELYLERRQVARALQRAAHAKNAKKPKAEEVDLDEEEEEEEEEADTEEEGDEDVDLGEGASADTDEEAAPEEESGSESSFSDQMFGIFGTGESLLLGGSIRMAALYRKTEEEPFRYFPMQLDLYGEYRFSDSLRAQVSLGAAKVPAGSPHARPAQVTTSEDSYNLISRTHWVAYDFGGGNHSFRVGRMNLPFGVRIPEHTMWVREATQTDRESDQQHGAALAMNFEKVRFELMGIAGNYQLSPDEYRERGYSGYLELLVDSRVALGINSLMTNAKNDRLQPEGLATTRQAHGVSFRAGPNEKMSVLAELDALLRTRRGMGYVWFLQLDYELTQGLHLSGTGEILDAGYPNASQLQGLPRVAGLGQPQLGGWVSVQWFFAPHFDLRLDAIKREEIPFQFLSQLHVYL